MNCFYASVEIMLNPSLRGKAVAVCGSAKDRHGIILAKFEKAKKSGVKTGMINRDALALCPDLILVPPQYEQYVKYSRLAREIYGRYTNASVLHNPKMPGDGRDLVKMPGQMYS